MKTNLIFNKGKFYLIKTLSKKQIDYLNKDKNIKRILEKAKNLSK